DRWFLVRIEERVGGEGRDREGVLRLSFVLQAHRDGRAGLGLVERRLEVEVVSLDGDLALLHGLLALVGDLPLELYGRVLGCERDAAQEGGDGGRADGQDQQSAHSGSWLADSPQHL